jgi:hypothetical protein
MRRRNNNNKTKARTTFRKSLLSKFDLYEPTTLSIKDPILILEHSNVVDFDSLAACIIVEKENIMFLMTVNYDFYILKVSDYFLKFIRRYKNIIIADKEIYNDSTKEGVILPIEIETK